MLDAILLNPLSTAEKERSFFLNYCTVVYTVMWQQPQMHPSHKQRFSVEKQANQFLRNPNGSYSML